MRRPVLFVLAGVNGAGKSSVGGHILEQAGMTWFNPDVYARELKREYDCPQTEANAAAWTEGMRRLDEAIANRSHFAFETTLGGNTVPKRIADAAGTHDVHVWYCGLSSPELHIKRVATRVAHGGHEIPEAKIRERYPASLANLIDLMPLLSKLQVYDNSYEAAAGQEIPDPILLLELTAGRLTRPQRAEQLEATPEWAKPLVEAALGLGR
jgi:predicted ABC-type ATPase